MSIYHKIADGTIEFLHRHVTMCVEHQHPLWCLCYCLWQLFIDTAGRNEKKCIVHRCTMNYSLSNIGISSANTLGAGSSAVSTTARDLSSRRMRMVLDGIAEIHVLKESDFSPILKPSVHAASDRNTWSSPDLAKSESLADTVRNMPFFSTSIRLLTLLEKRLTRRRMPSISFLSNTT